jgi:hypothetical protein
MNQNSVSESEAGVDPSAYLLRRDNSIPSAAVVLNEDLRVGIAVPLSQQGIEQLRRKLVKSVAEPVVRWGYQQEMPAGPHHIHAVFYGRGVIEDVLQRPAVDHERKFTFQMFRDGRTHIVYVCRLPVVGVVYRLGLYTPPPPQDI